MPGTGEVVALAEAAVELAKLGLVAQTLVAAALPTAAAQLLALRFPAGADSHTVAITLLALAVGTQISRLAVTGTTGVRTCKEGEFK